jgi:phospholipase D1/2
MGSRAAGELASRKGNSERDPSAGRQGNIRSTRKRILVEGRNCWRIAEAGRAAFLVDAAAYFDAFVSAVMKARESILILAWDIDSRVRLKRDDRDHGLPKELGNFLDAIISRRRGLHAHILAWDFHFIYAFEREPLPVVRLEWRTHPRLHFRLDGNHPFWASLHQKVMVVDDAVAFVGGLDLTRSRWDTPEHRLEDPRRIDPRGRPMGRFMTCRRPWTGKRPRSLETWPEGLEADLEAIHVGIARTEPSFEGSPGVREVEALHMDAVAPFTFVNLAAGAFRIRLLDFALGTVIGMAPGLFAITFFGERLSHAVRHPGMEASWVLRSWRR